MSREIARHAYETLEPYHVLAYFNPHNEQAGNARGLDQLGLYFGGRAAPLGRCSAAVVAATFYNFSPAYANHGWNQALTAGLPAVEEARNEALDASLREALGDLVDSPDLPVIVDAMRAGIVDASYAGRPLAAAWVNARWPDEPHLQFWHATAIAREHRGDGHLAALLMADLAPLEAVVLHEAPHPNPELRRRTLGKKAALLTRGWSEDDWSEAAESLQHKEILDATGAMTDVGARLYDTLEEQTDAAAAGLWARVPDAEATLAKARPFVKAVIDIGYLPGTKKKG